MIKSFPSLAHLHEEKKDEGCFFREAFALVGVEQEAVDKIVSYISSHIRTNGDIHEWLLNRGMALFDLRKINTEVWSGDLTLPMVLSIQSAFFSTGDWDVELEDGYNWLHNNRRLILLLRPKPWRD